MGDRSTTAGDTLLGARSIRAFLALIFVVVATSLAVRIAPAAAEQLRTAWGGSPEAADGWMDASVSIAIVLIAIVGALIFRRWLWLGDKRRGLGIAGVPIAFAGVAAAIGIAWLGGGVAAVDRGPSPGAGMFVAGSLAIGAAAVGEEVLVRGLLQPLLIRAWGPAAGILLASLGFALVHVSGGWIAPVSLLNIFLAGIWFGLLAWRTGGMLAPALAHATWNWTEAMAFGADPNPGRRIYGALTDLDLVGPAWLGGSTDGLNGSLLLTAILAAIILPLALRRGGQAIGSD